MDERKLTIIRGDTPDGEGEVPDYIWSHNFFIYS